MSPPPPLEIIRAGNASPMTLDGTRSFVVGRRRMVVIDPGPPDPAHLRALEARVRGAERAVILLTHAHPDHAGGAAELSRQTGAALWMARGALRSPVPEAAVDRWIGDGDRADTDAGGVVAVATPGHAPEHLCYHWTGAEAPAGGALFVGDLFMGQGDTTLVAPPEGDLRAYLRSLDRVAALGAGVLFPAHGPPLPDPADAVRRYRAHRVQRVRQVEEARRRQPGATEEALLHAVYGPELHPALREPALGSLRAILRYLDESRAD